MVLARRPGRHPSSLPHGSLAVRVEVVRTRHARGHQRLGLPRRRAGAGPDSVVQVVLAGGVVLIAVMADRLFGFQVAGASGPGSGLTAAGLVLLAVTLPASHGAHSALFNTPAMIAFEAGLFLVGGLLIMGPRAVLRPSTTA